MSHQASSWPIPRYLARRESGFPTSLRLDDKALKDEYVALLEIANKRLGSLAILSPDCGDFQLNKRRLSDWRWTIVLYLCSVEEGDSVYKYFLTLQRIRVCSKIIRLCEDLTSKQDARPDSGATSGDLGRNLPIIKSTYRNEKHEGFQKILPAFLTLLKMQPDFEKKDGIAKLYVEVLHALYSERDISPAVQVARRINEKYRAEKQFDEIRELSGHYTHWNPLKTSSIMSDELRELKKEIMVFRAFNNLTGYQLFETLDTLVKDLFELQLTGRETEGPD